MPRRRPSNAPPEVEKTVARPPNGWACWALKRVPGAPRSKPQHVHCTKDARTGCLTCYWHRDREGDAQSLRKQERSKK